MNCCIGTVGEKARKVPKSSNKGLCRARERLEDRKISSKLGRYHLPFSHDVLTKNSSACSNADRCRQECLLDCDREWGCY